jgi:hypothetical protein
MFKTMEDIVADRTVFPEIDYSQSLSGQGLVPQTPECLDYLFCGFHIGITLPATTVVDS